MCKHVCACAYIQNIYAAIFGNDNVRKTGMVSLVCEHAGEIVYLQHYNTTTSIYFLVTIYSQDVYVNLN